MGHQKFSKKQGKELVIYDSASGEMLLEIENELEIPIRQVRVPVTTLGIELARRTLTENDPDKILQSKLRESIDVRLLQKIHCNARLYQWKKWGRN